MAGDFYKRLRDQLIEHEGFHPYPPRRPAGKLTIGIGRNLEANGISEHEALYMLYNDLCRVRGELESHLPCFAALSEARRIALIDMCFNLGLPDFLGFERMLAALNAGDYDRAAREMLDSKWARQVRQRAYVLAEQVRVG